MSDFRIIFIHGYTASSHADWYPDIATELKKLGVDFTIPDLPGGDQPQVQEWLAMIHQEVQKNTKPLVLVGHSLGTRAALLYLETYRPQVETVLLIAAFANRIENGHRDDGETYPDFFDHLIDIERIRPLAKKFVVLHAMDDSSIPYEQGKEIAAELAAELITVTDRDHFSAPDNAPLILDIIRQTIPF